MGFLVISLNPCEALLVPAQRAWPWRTSNRFSAHSSMPHPNGARCAHRWSKREPCTLLPKGAPRAIALSRVWDVAQVSGSPVASPTSLAAIVHGDHICIPPPQHFCVVCGCVVPVLVADATQGKHSTSRGEQCPIVTVMFTVPSPSL